MTKLHELALSEGYAEEYDLIRSYVNEDIVPGICKKCDYTTFVEPDSTGGYCEVCGTQSVVSCLVLADII